MPVLAALNNGFVISNIPLVYVKLKITAPHTYIFLFIFNIEYNSEDTSRF